MSRAHVTSRLVATIARPEARNTVAAELRVEVCALTPPRAPRHVRPRYVTLTLRQPDREVTIGIRRRELADVIAALVAARDSIDADDL